MDGASCWLEIDTWCGNGLLKTTKVGLRRCFVGGIPNRMWCMMLREFISNPFEFINMWENMSVMAKHTTNSI